MGSSAVIHLIARMRSACLVPSGSCFHHNFACRIALSQSQKISMLPSVMAWKEQIALIAINVAWIPWSLADMN